MDSKRTIKSVVNVFDIIEFLRLRDGARLIEIADELEMAKSTIHQYLATLETLEFVVKEGNEYHLGLRFLDYGGFARSREPVYQLAKNKVVDLAAMTQERAQFVIEEHGRGVVVYTDSGSRAVRTNIRTGKRVQLHATAAGKAILAYLSDERVGEIFNSHGLKPVTENTVTDLEALFEEFEEIREQGVAYNNQEDTKGLRAIGVPVRDPNGEVLGALSVSGPVHRLNSESREREVSDLLLGVANELELNIEYM